MSNVIRLVIALLGISAVGFVVIDMLKKWQLLNQTISPTWIIVPLYGLFLSKELINSAWMKNNRYVSEETLTYMGRAVEILLILIFFIIIISLPFIWIGAIETVSGSADAAGF